VSRLQFIRSVIPHNDTDEFGGQSARIEDEWFAMANDKLECCGGYKAGPVSAVADEAARVSTGHVVTWGDQGSRRVSVTSRTTFMSKRRVTAYHGSGTSISTALTLLSPVASRLAVVRVARRSVDHARLRELSHGFASRSFPAAEH